MSAIITENFRRNNTSAFISDLGVNQYYVGLGKSDKWVTDEQVDTTVPTPLGTYLDEREIKSNLISLIGVTAANGTKVIPNNKFLTGKRYKAYDPINDNCFYSSTDDYNVTYLPCYVTVSGNIFLCLYAPPNTATSTIPSYVTKYAPYAANSGDGYVWILIDVVAVNSVNSVITDQFISITTDKTSDGEAALCKAAQGGLLYGFSVVNGGSGYRAGIDTAFTYTYTTSDATSGTIALTGTISSGSITVLTPTSVNLTTLRLVNVISGVVTLDSSGSTPGSGFASVAKIAPDVGFACYPYKILPAWYAAISVKAESLISGDGFYIPYRQISLLKNPLPNGVISNYGASMRGLPYLTLSGTVTVSTGDILTINGTTKIIVDTLIYDGLTYKLYYHQNNKSDYGNTALTTNRTIYMGSSALTPTILGSSTGEYMANSGEVVFIENRAAITRSESQTEEIKIIIQF